MLETLIVLALILAGWGAAWALCRAAACDSNDNPMGDEAADPERTREDHHAA